jgi:hypothetical protein
LLDDSGDQEFFELHQLLYLIVRVLKSWNY